MLNYMYVYMYMYMYMYMYIQGRREPTLIGGIQLNLPEYSIFHKIARILLDGH